MPCYVKCKESGNMFIRGRLGPHCRAEFCSWVSDYLCDYPVGKDKTCDRTLCSDHAYRVAPDIHYCAAHYNEWVKFKADGGVKNELENVVPFKSPK